ncbi:MAG: glycoside hydrolase family 43 protein [Adhaeribacter sp.]
MKSKTEATLVDKIMLDSPVGTPFGFSVIIGEAAEGNRANHTFAVTGPDPKSGAQKTCQYQLAGKEHTAYLDFFEKLSLDFGLRVPQNRRDGQPIPTINSQYQAVLRHNLSAGMLYGYGDPAVIRVNTNTVTKTGKYYLLATSNDAPDSFPIISSHNLRDWEFTGYVFPAGNKPIWAADGELISDYWAPEMHQVKEEFRVYFVARDKHTRELCIGLAKSQNPEGPFVPEEAPLLSGNVIDPHIYVQEDGKSYLFWKEDNNDVWPGKLSALLYANPTLITELFNTPEDQVTASFIITLWPWTQMLEPMERFLAQQLLIEAVIAIYSNFYDHLQVLANQQPAPIQAAIRLVMQYMKTPMFAQPLSSDGTTLIGERTQIIQNDLAWEAHLVEGMWVTKQGNKYYLFYAGNDFSTDQYGIGVAVADALLGPYQKMPKPFLQSTAEWWAPGHPSVVNGPNGKPVLFLHAYFPGQAGYKQFRALLAVPLQFTPTGVLAA